MASDLTVGAVAAQKATVETPLTSHPFRTKKTPDAAQKFEAFVLQTFIQEMMPEKSEGVYGSGPAGEFWKSMMSEKIAAQVAERGTVGIANYVRAGHTVPVRPGGMSSLNVLSTVSTLNGAVTPPLDVAKVLGE